VTAGTDDEDGRTARHDETLWIGAALALPVFCPGDGSLIRHWQATLGGWQRLSWMQFALATPVVGWAGWPLLHAVRSVVTRT